jgi:hypothetical protein
MPWTEIYRLRVSVGAADLDEAATHIVEKEDEAAGCPPGQR